MPKSRWKVVPLYVNRGVEKPKKYRKKDVGGVCRDEKGQLASRGGAAAGGRRRRSKRSAAADTAVAQQKRKEHFPIGSAEGQAKGGECPAEMNGVTESTDRCKQEVQAELPTNSSLLPDTLAAPPSL